MLSRNRPDRDDRQAPRAFGNRGGRAEYLIWLASIALLLLLSHGAARFGVALLLGFATARRLRDFGLLGWWVALLPIVGLAAGVVGRAGDVPPLWLGLLAILGLLAFIIAVAVIPGDPDPNRFGPPFRLTGRGLRLRDIGLSSR